MNLLKTISSLIEKYGADATLEDVLYDEQQSLEQEEFLEALEEDVQYMSEATLKSMLADPKTSLECLEFIKNELAQRPRKTAIRVALLDRARMGAFHVPSFYDGPEISRQKKDAMETHKKVMRLRDYKDMEKNICVYENHRSQEAIMKLFAMIDCNNMEVSRFHKEVVALVLARVLRTWWPSALPVNNYTQKLLDESALASLGDFLRETANSDQTVAKEIITSIRHNVKTICTRCGDIETLLQASRDFKSDPVCHECIGAALALALKKVVTAVGVNPDTNRVHYQADKITVPLGSANKRFVKPILIHKLKIATHLSDDVREVLRFFPNTDRIGEAFCKTRRVGGLLSS